MRERSVELVTGPYRAGKTMWLLRELVDYLLRSPLTCQPVFLIVPSHRYKGLVEERVDGILKELGAPGLIGLTILPFYDLCHSLLRRAGVSFRLLGDGLRAAVLQKALGKVQGEGRLNSLASISEFAGTHAQMLELIDELERAGLSPRDVLSTLSRSAASDSRYIELAGVYQAYWAELEALDVYDERKLAYKAREVARAGSSSLAPGIFAIDGFDRFNPLQLSVLSAVSELSARTLISFDYVDAANDEKYGEYAWKDKSIKGLREAFQGAQGKFTERFQGPDSARGVGVERLLSRTLDRAMEMEEVARSVKECLHAGTDTSEIIVVARSLKDYLPAIKAAFERAGLEYYLDEAVPVASLPVIKYLLRLLSLVTNDFSRLEVIRTLRSPFCNLVWLDLTPALVERLDRLSLSGMVVAGRADWCFQLKGADRDLEPAQAAVARLIERLEMKESGTLSYFVAAVEDIIEDLLILPSDEEYADPLMAWEEHQGLLEFRRILSDMVFEDELLTPVYGESVLTYQEFLKRLERAFENSNFRRPRSGSRAVTICSADLVPNRRFEVVFLTGLNEGEFPRRGERSGFLSRDEVRKWAGLGIDIENPRQHESFEISLFTSLLERATSRLYLSAPVYELSGEELVPSFFLTEGEESKVKSMQFAVPRQKSLLAPVSPMDYTLGFLFASEASAQTSTALKLSEALQQALPFAYQEEGETCARNLAEPLTLVQSRTSPGAMGRPGLTNGDMQEQVGLGLIGVDLPEFWSVSRLSDYGKCPFKFWVSHFLKVSPELEPEAGLDARLLGEVYHKCMELFYQGLKVRGLNLLSEAQVVDGFFDDCIADALVWLLQERQVKKTEFWDYEKKEVYFRLRRFLTKEKARALKDGGEFQPVAFEKSFGFEGAPGEVSAPPLVVQALPRGGSEVSTVRLRGRIDRIDRSHDGRIKVVDYKAGSKRITIDDARRGSDLQMPVYALAVANMEEGQGPVCEGLFLSISQGEVIGRVDFAGEGPELLSLVKEHIVSFAAEAARGRFQIAPIDDKVCLSCDHQRVCRIAELGKEMDLEGGED